MEHVSEIFFQNGISKLLSLLLFISLGILMLIFLSKGKYKNLHFITRRIQSPVTERWLIKSTYRTIIITLFGLMLNTLFQPNPKNIRITNWVGIWTVNLEEFDDLNFLSTGKYEIDFTINNGVLVGNLINEKHRNQANLKNISIEEGGYSFIKGKIGNMDGRKQEFQFMMFPDGKAFVGKYRIRNSNDDWKIWISHKK